MVPPALSTTSSSSSVSSARSSTSSSSSSSSFNTTSSSPTNTSDLAAIFEEYIEAYNDHDLPRLLSHLDPTTRSYTRGVPTHRSHAALRASYRADFAQRQKPLRIQHATELQYRNLPHPYTQNSEIRAVAAILFDEEVRRTASVVYVYRLVDGIWKQVRQDVGEVLMDDEGEGGFVGFFEEKKKVDEFRGF